MLHKSSTKLVISASVLLMVAIVLVFAFWNAFIHFKPVWLQQVNLSETARDVVAGLRFDANGKPVTVEFKKVVRSAFDALADDLLYQIVDANGHILLGSVGIHEAPLEIYLNLPESQESINQHRRGLTLHLLKVPIETNSGRLYVIVARSERLDDALLANQGGAARAAALVATLTALIVFAAVVLMTVRHLLRALRDTSSAASRIDPSNLAERLDISKVPAEIVPLIESFNAALERLEHGYRIQKEFLATAAHELKTPLALMRGQIELGGQADQTALLKDVDHMARQVHQLLHLAEVSEAQNFTPEILDVCDVVQDAVVFLARLAETRNVIVYIQRPADSVSIAADRGALFVLVRNLVENAVHHSPTNGVVSIDITKFGFFIRDHGPGFNAQDSEKMFERFWRGAHRRDEGAGLGLAICKEVSRAHNWMLSAACTDISGTVFSVYFKPFAENAVPSTDQGDFANSRQNLK